MPLDDAPPPVSLAERIEAQALEANVQQLADDGYTVIADPAALAIADETRAAILRLVDKDPASRSQTRFTLLDLDPVFAKAIATPQLLTLVEVLLGQGALFSQLAGSVRRKGPGSLGLHADNSWFPEPFPEWEIMCTACFVLDDFTEESGATLVIPGSHKEKSHPPRDIRATLLGAEPIIAPKGSICLWDGSVWHGNYPRQIDGERVVLHMTYTRLGLAQIETYDHLGDAWFAGKHPALARLLGRQNFLGRRHGWKQDGYADLLAQTYRQAHGPKGY